MAADYRKLPQCVARRADERLVDPDEWWAVRFSVKWIGSMLRSGPQRNPTPGWNVTGTAQGSLTAGDWQPSELARVVPLQQELASRCTFLYIETVSVYSYRKARMSTLTPSALTPRQRQILKLIQDSIRQNGMPPTRAEIAEQLGFKSPNAAEEHLRALQRKGVIDLIPSASRGIQLKDSLREQLGLPLIGRVAAGRPILAEEHIESRYQIDPKIFQPKAHYLLKVRGMSMKDIGILDGDLVAVHRTPEVRNRQIVVARLENDVTVKRYKQEGSTVWLLPENEDFDPIKVNMREQSLVIEGVVVGVLRQTKSKGMML
jgi:repressor LexA